MVWANWFGRPVTPAWMVRLSALAAGAGDVLADARQVAATLSEQLAGCGWWLHEWLVLARIMASCLEPRVCGEKLVSWSQSIPVALVLRENNGLSMKNYNKCHFHVMYSC